MRRDNFRVTCPPFRYKKWLVILSIFLGWKYPSNMIFNFENKTPDGKQWLELIWCKKRLDHPRKCYLLICALVKDHSITDYDRMVCDICCRHDVHQRFFFVTQQTIFLEKFDPIFFFRIENYIFRGDLTEVSDFINTVVLLPRYGSSTLECCVSLLFLRSRPMNNKCTPAACIGYLYFIVLWNMYHVSSYYWVALGGNMSVYRGKGINDSLIAWLSWLWITPIILSVCWSDCICQLQDKNSDCGDALWAKFTTCQLYSVGNVPERWDTVPYDR